MRFVLGIMLAMGAIATPALADTNLGDLYTKPTKSIVTWAASPTPVTDVYTFALTGTGMVEGELDETKKINNFTATLYSPSNAVLNSYTITFGENYLDFGSLSAGSYSLKLSGTPASGRGGTGGYSLTLHSNLAPAPVPGPAGWVVAIAGAGAVAYSIRRRSKGRWRQAAA